MLCMSSQYHAQFDDKNPPRQLNCCQGVVCTNCATGMFSEDFGSGGYCICCFKTVDGTNMNEVSKEISISEAVQVNSEIVQVVSLNEMQSKANFWYTNSVTLDISPEVFFDTYMTTLKAWKTWMAIDTAKWIDGRRTDDAAVGAVLCRNMGNYKFSEKIIVWERPNSSTNTSGDVALTVVST